MRLSSATPPGVLSAQLPNPREYDPRSSRDFGAADTLWNPVQYTFVGEVVVYPDSASNVSPWIEATGNTFEILELEGANVIGVRFDTVGQFIKMQDGDVFEGTFSRVQFKAFQTVGATTSLLDAAPFPDIKINAVATSGGKLIKAPRREGFTAGFQTWTGSANSSSGTDVIAAYKTMYASGGAGFRRNLMTPGANGGQIVLKNTGDATIYVYTQNPRSTNLGVWWDTTLTTFPNIKSAFPLLSNETLTIPLKSRLQTLMVATSGGTTGSWAAMADSLGDMTTTGEGAVA